MTRSLGSGRLALVLALGAVSSSGCTLFVGQPWGEAEVSLAAAFAPADDRVSEEGWLKTSRDYALDIHALRVTFDVVTLTIEGADDGTASEGALCHGGHCHGDESADANEEGELSDDGMIGTAALALHVHEGEIPLRREPTALEVEPCAGGCALPRGSLHALGVEMTGASVEATVHDLRPAGERRLPAEGAPLSAHIVGLAVAHTELELALDGSEEPHLQLDAVLELAPALFDDVELGALPRDADGAIVLDEASEAAVLATLADSELHVDVTRAPLERSLTPVLLPEAHVHEDEHEHEHEEDTHGGSP